MHPFGSPLTVSLLTLTTLAATLGAAASSVPRAATHPDRSSPDLALRTGETLAPSKILDLRSDPVDISRTVEDQDRAQRRTDTARDVTYELQAGVLFTKDSARLSDSARSRIAAIARSIEQHPATRVRISGFTDNLGSAAHGKVLSEQRARAVQTVLAGELRATAVTFETHGFGERQPIASNATEAGRQMNRRVEISFPRTAR
ncbi:OmpA family protein [Streptomyces sp. NPDC047043]|uniref:OmpA family protein n=1 Tax=Streptomyces sp. NPDC047043 TaxID=3154497 RepID=UPI0033CAC18A